MNETKDAIEHRIVFLDRATISPATQLRTPAFPHGWTEYESTQPGEIVERCAGAGIVIVNKVPMSAEHISALPDLKMIAVAATGTDKIDLAACAGRGIVVSNVRGYALNTVPEHTFALILALRRSIPAYRDSVARGAWHASGQFCYFDHPIGDLAGARLGIDHFPSPVAGAEEEAYWVVPVLLLAAEALMMVLATGGRDSGLPRWTAVMRGGVAGVAAVLVTALLKDRILPDLAWDVTLYGLLLVVAIVMAALTRDEREDEGFQPVALSFGAALLILAVVAVAFRSLHGYGEALALIAGLPVIAAAYLSRERASEPVSESIALGGVTVMLLLTLNRVFIERAGKGLALDFQQHYDYLSVVLGLGACFGLMAFSTGGGARATPATAVRTIFLMIVIVVVPPALAAVWGVKALNAFLIGLVFAQVTWMLLVAWTSGRSREMVLAGAPMVPLVAATLVAIRLAPSVLTLELTRAVKVLIAAGLMAVVLIWIGVDAWRRSRAKGGPDQ